MLEEESPQCQPPHHAYSSRSQHPREQSNTASIRTTIASRDGGTSGSPGSTSANVSNQTLRHSGGDTTVSFMAQVGWNPHVKHNNADHVVDCVACS